MSDNLNHLPRIAIIIPTLGNREKYLEECIRTIKAFHHAYLVVISPHRLALSPDFTQLIDEFLIEEGEGLAAAIKQLLPFLRQLSISIGSVMMTCLLQTHLQPLREFLMKILELLRFTVNVNTLIQKARS